MPLELSRIITGKLVSKESVFAAARIDVGAEPAFTSPVLNLDEFRMTGVTFAPHPHAGFSAISYMFDDSVGAMRNRDSLGHDFAVGPGGIIWTQAGSGVMHDELPETTGEEVYGLQIFINLSSAGKRLPPAVYWHSSGELPVVVDDAGNEVKVVVGRYGDAASPLEPSEPVSMYDVLLAGQWGYRLPDGNNATIYVAQGTVAVEADSDCRELNKQEAVGAKGEGIMRLSPIDGQARVVLIAGKPLNEPVAEEGPFVMTSREELEDAVARYRAGAMGRLEPLGHDVS